MLEDNEQHLDISRFVGMCKKWVVNRFNFCKCNAMNSSGNTINIMSEIFLTVFLLYCLHIISVNVFHVETGKQTIHKKEREKTMMS